MMRQRRRTFVEGTGAGTSVDINAPADVVWRILLNVESNSKLFRTCHSVKNLKPRKSLNPVVPGAKFDETRIFDGQTFSFITNVTMVDHSAHKLSLATTFNNCTVTSTECVLALGDARCRLSVVCMMVPNGWRGRLYLWMNKKRLEGDGHDACLMDLQDLKYKAETGKYNPDKDPTSEDCNTSTSEDMFGVGHLAASRKG